MSETAGAASLSKLGFAKGQIVQEFGYDDDVDDDLRFELEDAIGTELEDEDFNDGADGVLIWYRDGEDVHARMPGLSTFLGHADPKSTYWYLTGTPQLLALAAARLECMFGAGDE